MASAPGSSTDISPTWIAQTILTDEMLARFAKRAPQYDRDNVFFSDDFDDLRQAGYLRLAIPAELGGAGLSLAGVAQQQRRLGYYAAPTALAVITAMAARGRRGWRSVRCRARRERQRHSGAALDDKSRARGRRVSLHRP